MIFLLQIQEPKNYAQDCTLNFRPGRIPTVVPTVQATAIPHMAHYTSRRIATNHDRQRNTTSTHEPIHARNFIPATTGKLFKWLFARKRSFLSSISTTTSNSSDSNWTKSILDLYSDSSSGSSYNFNNNTPSNCCSKSISTHGLCTCYESNPIRISTT